MSLPIMSAEGRLTDEQKQLVEQHIDVANVAGHWLTRCYRVCGWTSDDAKGDAYAWLVYSAMRFKPGSEAQNGGIEVLGGAVFLPPENPKPASFATYYWSNIKWWRSDVRSRKPAEIRRWERTASLEHIASMSPNDGGAYNMDCLAIEDGELQQPDDAEERQRIETILVGMVKYGHYLMDYLNGVSYRELMRKHGHRHVGQVYTRLMIAKKEVRQFFQKRLFSGRV